MTLFIANRGEIAVRIIAACRELGFRSVVAASEPDARSQAALFADAVALLPGVSAAETYLNAPLILQSAREQGATLLHPGYGFLSEQAEFAEACAAAGITFIGPRPDAMRRLGRKTDAKRLAQEAGVPIVPGLFRDDATREDLAAAARDMGYPVLLKAAAGGGGRGMRAVYDPNEFHELYDRAVDEAARSFGDGRMMVEKLIQRPRHVEVQLLADTHGHVSTLFERDCSVQRRRQKLIEEAPAPNADDLGPKLADEARRLAEHAGYTNAGTAEFIVDADSGDYYFLEVNARLQVEHPVTEQITGVDLVQAQIAVALGERVEFRLERANIRGWSIEARINGEDPNENFRPAVGRLHIVHWPRRPGVRIDAGFASGDEVTPHYDSLLAKIIAHAPTRDEAIRRLRSALEETVVLGPATNIGFLIRVLQDPRFTEGTFDTNLIEREGLADRNLGPPPPEIELLAGVATAAPSYGEVSRRPPSVWEAIDGFRNA